MTEMLGEDFELYYDSGDNYSSPTWGGEQCSVGDVGFDQGGENVEVPKRCGTKAYKKGRNDWRLTFTMNFEKDDTFHEAVRDAIRTGDPIHLALADGDIANNTTDYWHAWWLLSGPLDASLDTPATYEVEAMPHTNMGVNNDEVPAFVAS